MHYIIFLPLVYFISMFIFLAITKLTILIADKYNGLTYNKLTNKFTTNKLNSTTPCSSSEDDDSLPGAEKYSSKSLKNVTIPPLARQNSHGYNLRSRKGPKHRPAFNGLM